MDSPGRGIELAQSRLTLQVLLTPLEFAAGTGSGCSDYTGLLTQADPVGPVFDQLVLQVGILNPQPR